MSKPKEKPLPWERLIERESRDALERFRRRDFQAELERRLRTAPRPTPWFRRPPALAASLAAALLLAAGIGVISSNLALKRQMRELKSILMRIPEMRTPLAALAPAEITEEEARLIELSWVFRLAGERLAPESATEAGWRSALEWALVAPGAATAPPWRPRALSRAELLRLEKRLEVLIAASELQRLRERNKSNRI